VAFNKEESGFQNGTRKSIIRDQKTLFTNIPNTILRNIINSRRHKYNDDEQNNKRSCTSFVETGSAERKVRTIRQVAIRIIAITIGKIRTISRFAKIIFRTSSEAFRIGRKFEIYTDGREVKTDRYEERNWEIAEVVIATFIVFLIFALMSCETFAPRTTKVLEPIAPELAEAVFLDIYRLIEFVIGIILG